MDMGADRVSGTAVLGLQKHMLITHSDTGLYTDESPGLKVDPVIVLVLSLVFIFSVVALHSMYYQPKQSAVACVDLPSAVG